MNIYCLKCKAKTPTLNPSQFLNQKNRPMVRGACSKCKMTKTQLLPTKEGGLIFSVPMTAAAASALGSLAGGAASIANAVNQKKTVEKNLKEKMRHNKAMEKKKGDGLYLKPYKGKGLYLKPFKT